MAWLKYYGERERKERREKKAIAKGWYCFYWTTKQENKESLKCYGPGARNAIKKTLFVWLIHVNFQQLTTTLLCYKNYFCCEWARHADEEREMLCLKHFIDIRELIWWFDGCSKCQWSSSSAENFTSILRSSFLREARESVIMLNQPKKKSSLLCLSSLFHHHPWLWESRYNKEI